jgi:hypothetical protein
MRRPWVRPDALLSGVPGKAVTPALHQAQRRCKCYQIVAVNERSAKVVPNHLCNWNRRPCPNELMQAWLLAHHQPFVKEKAGIVGRGDAQHKTALVAVYPVGCVVLARANRREAQRIGVGVNMSQYKPG